MDITDKVDVMGAMAVPTGRCILVTGQAEGPVDTLVVNLGNIIVAIGACGWFKVLGMRHFLNIGMAVDTRPVAMHRVGIDIRIHMQGDLLAVYGLCPAGIIMAIKAAFIRQVIFRAADQAAQDEDQGEGLS